MTKYQGIVSDLFIYFCSFGSEAAFFFLNITYLDSFFFFL